MVFFSSYLCYSLVSFTRVSLCFSLVSFTLVQFRLSSRVFSSYFCFWQIISMFSGVVFR